MKKILHLMLVIMLGMGSWQMSAQTIVEIPTTGGTTGNSYLPSYSFYNYSLTQQLYTANEIGMTGVISSVAFYNSGTTKTRTYTMYMVNTNKTSFTGSTDWIAVTASDEVFTGSVTMTANTWTTIDLDVPFFYDGSGNLAIIMDDNTGSYSSGMSCYAFDAPNMAIRVYSDGTNYNPMAPSSYSGTTMSVKNHIKLEITPGVITCHNVGNVTVSNITSNNATLTWNTPEDAGTYILQYKLSTENWDGSNVVTEYPFDTTYDFSNTLSPQTEYDVRVANLCGNGDTSMWRSARFMTECAPIDQLPYVQYFDNYGTGVATAYPPCWSKYSTYTASSALPYISSTHFEGAGSLYLYVATSGTYNTAIAPQFDVSIPINTLMATFMYRASNSTDRLIVGVMDSPTDPTSFVPVDTIYPSSPVSTWVEREVSFAQYMGTGQYIAFKNQYTTQSCYSYVDNLMIDLIPACPKPKNVVLTNYTTEGCDVSWTPQGYETAWEVVAVPSNEDVSLGTPEQAYGYPFTLTGLADDTQYDVYVRAVCDDGSYSPWSFKTSFTTDPFCTSPMNLSISQVQATSAMVNWNSALYGATAYTVGYSESGQGNWTTIPSVTGTNFMLSGLNMNTVYDVFVLSECDQGDADTVFLSFQTKACLVGGDLAIGSDNSTTEYFPEYSLYEYSYTQQIFLASEMSGPADISSIAFECTTLEDPVRNLQIYLMHTSSASGSSWLSASNAQLVKSGNVTFTTGWNIINFTTPFQYNGTDNLALVVLDVTGTWTSTNEFSAHTTSQSLCRYVYQDGISYSINTVPDDGYSSFERNNVIFGVPCDPTATCAAPNMYVGEVTDNSVTVAWAPGNMENAWELEYSLVGQSTWISEGSVTSPYTISNLTSDTKYTIRVRAVCGGGEYSSWSGVDVRTACSDAVIPYTENFDDAPGSGSGNMVTCWTTGSNYTSTHFPYTSSTQHYSGSYSAYFYGTSAYYSYLASPQFDESVDMSNLQVRFYAYKTTASYYIQVGIMTDPNDPNTFVQVGQNLTPSTTSTWEMLDVNTDNYTGNGRYIAFRIPAMATSYMYVDDITVDEIPLCLHVTNIQAASATTTSADLSWTPGGDETEWAVVYAPAGTITDPENVTPEIASGNPEITLSNLFPSTEYDVFVKSVCSSTESSIWWHATFSTLCGDITVLPFMENFDNMGSGTAVYPNCWMRHNNYSTTTNYPYVSTTYHNSGNASLYFYSSSTTYNYAVLPPIDVNTYPINTLQISFQMRSTSSATTSSIQVGVMTDSSDVSTFVPVQTVNNTTTSVFQLKEVPLASYTGTGKFIALKLINTSSTYSIYVDDIIVEVAPLCDKPTNVTASNLTASGADINWLPGGDETGWEVVVVPAGASIAAGTPVPVSTHPYTLDNLNDNTAYDVYVRADCGTGVDFSSWSQACHFTTTPLCSAPTNVVVSQVTGSSALLTWTPAVFGATGYTVAYTETGMNNWTSQSVTGDNFMLAGLTPETAYTVTITSECDEGTAPAVTRTFTTSCLYGGGLHIGSGTSTTGYFPEYSLYEYSYTQQIFLASELNGPADINSIAFECATVADPTRNLQVYLMHTTSTSGNSWLSASSAQQVYSGNYTFASGWNTFNFSTPFQYNGTDNLAVIVVDVTGSWTSTNEFRSHTASQSLCRYVYQDDIPYSISSTPSDGYSSNTRNNVVFGTDCDYTVTCVAPNVYVSDMTENSITVNWAPGNGESSWELEYNSEDDTTWVSQGTVTSAPYTINNLQPNTLYNIRLRSVCGSGEYSNWVVTSARTDCGTITIPFVESFDSYGTGTTVYPLCWGKINTYTSGDRPYVNSTHYDGVGSLYFYGSSGTYNIAVVPEMDATIPVNTLQATFMYRASSSSDRLIVGVMTDPSDANTFVPVDTVHPASTAANWEEREVVFNNYSGNGQYIAFYNGSPTATCYSYIDHLTIDLIPSCPKPHDVHAVSVTSSSVELGWTEVGTATSWVIEYGPAGFTLGNGTEVTATTNPFTVDNLAPATQYDFYVKADCGGGDISNNSTVFSTFTECEAISQIPFTENFDGVSGATSTSVANNNLPLCWRNLNQGTSSSYSGYPIVYSSSTYAASGNNAMRFYIYTTSGTYDDQMAILPEIDVNTFPMNTLQVSFDARNNSTYTFTLVIGVISNPLDKTTFVPVDTLVTTSGTYTNYEFPLSQYTGTGRYIALMAPRPTSSYNSGYVDNIEVNFIPSCPKPNNLHVVNVSSSSIELGWTEMGSATSWEIAYGAPGFDPEGSSATVVTATANPFTINNLNSVTAYEFYVRATCSVTDVSNWSSSLQVSTSMDPVALPYTADFTSAGDAWVLENGNCTNYWVKGTVEGAGALFVTNNGTSPNYTTSYSVVAAQKLFAVGTADSITITFDIMVDGEASYDYFKLFLAPPTQQFPASSSSATPTSGDYWYHDYSLNAYNFYAHGYGTQSSHVYVLNKLNATIHVTAKMPNPNVNPTAASTALLALVWRNDGSVTYNPPATITNLSVAVDDGPAITNPTVATNAANPVAQTTATLKATITNPDNVTITAKGFEWKTTTGGTYTQVAGTGTGNTFTAALSNLTPNTNYTYKAFITYNGQTAYGSEMTFTTLEQGVEPCAVPTGLTATDIQGESFTVTWNSDANVNSWNIQYRPQGGQLSTATSTTNSYTVTGLVSNTTYEIQVQANCGNGNLSDWSPTITVTTTGIENWLENSVTLFPNPANNVVNVQCTMSNVQSVEVFDVYGKLVNTVGVCDTPVQTRINVSGLADGMYFVHVTTDRGVVTKSFVKK